VVVVLFVDIEVGMLDLRNDDGKLLPNDCATVFVRYDRLRNIFVGSDNDIFPRRIIVVSFDNDLFPRRIIVNSSDDNLFPR